MSWMRKDQRVGTVPHGLTPSNTQQVLMSVADPALPPGVGTPSGKSCHGVCDEKGVMLRFAGYPTLFGWLI